MVFFTYREGIFETSLPTGFEFCLACFREITYEEAYIRAGESRSVIAIPRQLHNYLRSMYYINKGTLPSLIKFTNLL